MKNKKIITACLFIIILALVGKIIVNEYEIREYKSQITDLRTNIRNSNITDSVLGLQRDSTGRYYYVVRKGNNGIILTYQDLLKTVDAQEHIIEMQDIVIRNAKNLYKFNYAIKDSNGVVTTRFWDK